VNSLEYFAGLFRKEAERLRAEVDPDVRSVTGTSDRDRMANSLDRMASKIETTAASGLVEEV
jgi:hypothetical protein